MKHVPAFCSYTTPNSCFATLWSEEVAGFVGSQTKIPSSSAHKLPISTSTTKTKIEIGYLHCQLWKTTDKRETYQSLVTAHQAFIIHHDHLEVAV